MSRLVLFIAAFFIGLQLQAQPFGFSPQQAYTFVYKLDSLQSAFAYKRHITDTPWLFTNKVDSFLQARPNLAPGMYVLARYQEPHLYYEIYNVPFARVSVNSFNDLVQVRLLDSTWQIDPNLKFWVDKKLIPLDTLCDCYTLERSKAERHYYIKKGNAFMMGELTGDYKTNPSAPPSYEGGNPAISHGYFILNQPKYHPQDSVKLKAYILNGQGIAFTRPLKLYLVLQDYPYTRVFMGNIKPETRGAYVHQFKLADTLKIDRRYRLEFEDKGKATLQAVSFTIEDYKLRNSTYSADVEKSKIYKGEQIKFVLHAKDANDLPLTDARVRVRLRLNSFHNFTGKVLFVPNEWYEKLYETFVEMDISKATEISIPSKVLPPLDMRLTAEISFSNAAGELQKKEIALEVVQESNYYTFLYQDGKVYGSFVSQGEISKVKAIVKGYNNNSILRIDTVLLPTQFYIDPNCDKYLWQDSLGRELQWVFLPHLPQPVVVTGLRTHDSIFIQSHNPGNFPFYYRIYKGDKLILAGKERNLVFEQVDTSFASYNIIYTYMYKAWAKIHEAVFTFKEKELNVKTNLPYVIYPGQTLAVDIKVLNSEREPQANVNLSAFGINAQFDGMYTPYLPYYGVEKSRIYVQDRTRYNPWPFPNQQLMVHNISYTTLLKAGIVHMGDYRLRYPNELFVFEKKKLNRAQAEFIPFVVANGKRIEVYYMEIDGIPVFIKGPNPQSKASIISEGNHKLTLRTKTSMYTLPSLYFADSFRYIISFDTLCLPIGIQKKILPSHYKFDEAEMQKIKDHLFVFSPLHLVQKNSEIFMVQKHQCQDFVHPLGNKYLAELRQYQYYFGLFAHDSISVYAGGNLLQKVRFEPKSRYVYFRERIIREDLDSVELPYEFAFFKSQDESFRSLYDTALIMPIKTSLPGQGQSNQTTEKDRLTVDETCYFKYRFEPKPNDGSVRTKVVISGLQDLGVRNVLVVNREDELKSLLNPELNAGSIELHLWLNQGISDFYFTGVNNRLSKFMGQEVLANGQLLLRLDSTDFKYNCNELDALIPKAKKLEEIFKMRESMLVNYRKEDYVEVREKTSLQISASEDKLPILSGFVFDKYGVVLSDVIITLEQNGKVKGISFSDATGGFLIRDIESGTYQLRLTRFGSCVTILQQVSLQKNKLHSLNIKLQDCGFASFNGVSKPNIYFGKSTISKEEIETYNQTKEPYIPGMGIIKGKVVDVQTKRPMDYVSVSLRLNGIVRATSMTDDEGEFVVKNLAAGSYDLVASFFGYQNVLITHIEVAGNEIRFVNFTMQASTGTTLQDVVIANKRSLVDRGEAIESEQVMRAPSMSYNSPISSGSTPNFRGSRADGTAYYIDGVRVSSGAVNTPMNSMDKVEVVNLKVENSFEVEQKKNLLRMIGNQEIKEQRDNFRDYAFWVPNLVTNKYGEAHVSITFPDNITRWRNFILAMDEGLRTKVYTHDIKAYKPLSANLYIPVFALKGDAIYIKGKLNNYTGDTLAVKTVFTYADSTLKSNKHQLSSGLVEKTLVRTEKTDTLKLGYGLETDFNYADGEKYLLPVLPNGIEQTSIKYVALDKDTTLVFSTELEGQYALSICNNYTQLLRDEIERLQQYHYGCVEQTASKLNALLVEKNLCKLLGDSFTHEGLIKVCIKKLESMQQSNGSYGWFSKSGAEMWLTYYVLKSLQEANKMGYRTPALQEGINYLKKGIYQFSMLDQIRSMHILFDSRVDFDYAKIIDNMDEESLPFYERLVLTSLKQKMQLPHFSGFLFEGIQRDAEGGIYWNQPYVSIYQNMTGIGLLAYEVLKFDGADSGLLAGIRKYYFNERVFGSNRYRNTLESAQVLQAMAKDIALFEKGDLHTQVKLNGKDLGNRYPIKLPLKNNSSYKLVKSGANAKMFVSRKLFEEKPLADTVLFRINSHFTQDRKHVDTLKTNFEVNYVVQVFSLKNQEYVMVQIPIPASCNYLSKINTFGADEIEYHKDRVILYFRKLRAGTYVFKFALEPRFAGVYTLLPVQLENMYNPEIKGNNLSRQIWVKEK